MKTAIIAAALLVAGLGAALAPAPAQAQVNVNIVIGNPPPPPRYEAVPRARPGYIWAPGYWNADGGRHNWRAGHWERAREGQVYYRPQWVQADNGWRLQEGGWRRGERERHERDERHDRDGERRGHHGDDHGDDDRRGDRRDDHGRGHCPPGQAKKGNC